MSQALVGGKIVTPFRIVKNGVILFKEGVIQELGKASDVKIPDNCEIIDISGHTIAPGFVDLLVHGGGGNGFADANDQSIKKVSDYFLRNGSTTILASLFAKPYKQLLDDLNRVATYIQTNPDSNIYGIHMEGPYLNKGLKGAMNESYLWEPTVASFDAMWEASKGLMKIMTIAPELPGSIGVMRAAAKRGVVLSIGHSMATYDEIELAIDNGAAHVTHIFNAMKPFHHRDGGVILGALLRNELKIELIADKLHVHPAVMELLLKLKGASGIILITDSIRAGGMHEGEYEFADQKIFMKDQKAFLPDGTLAGSTLTLNKAIKNLVETANAKLTDAVRMASVNGAKVLNIENRKGILAVGKDADMVVMNDLYEVVMTVLGGKIVYQKKIE
ncbi:MAG: N-acetylglucosamine-6-phosphate deacetylase [Ignavibacteria bacterium CG_4_8_14_3_um_filter_37_9]|nr:N-acetylglucosamine-6-phosphate deacetylase [Ignavibacteria bacterium]OIO23605.1 MAG: N-acetylglucosamine-6-phosphate deacetylase [Ignavibacteria bacterium CG1_02_37_35]PIP78673.1 MAG: N-acetylglucosamine-6-phosphate deacetylase [Ignavibacteria bacterium CG22_combo_CG10-13_8_21_14_all_37_15]PIS46077.1 MAG: N-acetylglucosamine-6-phosphate deacetylase [Ignavibacteria bacterium CG08_land_8_20_14_0_20_37_9]PIX00049.1 MAG: N-acetylglucosamine-6-phosphate deacetylase [Ignavibacteria bacterium CG_4